MNRYEHSNKNWWRYDPKHVLLKRIGDGARVLDVGCSHGELGYRLINEKSCVVDGLELDPIAIANARRKLRQVFEIDLNNCEKIDRDLKEKYDVITFTDVLEHCINPEQVLQVFRKKLSPNGKVLISLPNIVNIRTRLQIMLGNFDYTEYGVLDRTHLRFYTPKTALQMIQTQFSNTKLISYSPVMPKLRYFVKMFPHLLALHSVFESHL